MEAKKSAKEYIGTQIWVEPDDTKERVEYLVKTAKETGIGWIRTFLIWPWIEAEPDVWDFRVFDYLFDACETYGIKIKATLTANSGPWHIGTPSVLHSHTGFLDRNQWEATERYIAKCVNRYKQHPALGQWILWNEPTGGDDRTEETLGLWQHWLSDKYDGDLNKLNKRWRTGYKSFNEIPFPENVAHTLHRGSHWESYGPHMDNCAFKCYWLALELKRVKDVLRLYDKKTETCVNPIPFLENQAVSGVDMEMIGKTVEVLGASYHPAWNFTFADRSLFSALMAVGVKKQASHPSVKRVEITELQSGNTLNSSKRPSAVTPDELARFYLSGIFSGAESVTGWIFNIRSYDFEAGDWGLLNDLDDKTDRSMMLKKLHDRLEYLIEKVGEWKPAKASVTVAFSFGSQKVEAVNLIDFNSQGFNFEGRLPNDSALGTALINALLMQQGVTSDMQRFEDLPGDMDKSGIIWLSNLAAWEKDAAIGLIPFVENGGTLVLDATCGRKDEDATMHRPWPGGISELIGLKALGLETNPQGYELSLFGNPSGKWVLTRMIPEFMEGSDWHAWEELRFTNDGLPCVWERKFGSGRIIFVNGILGPSLVHEASSFFSVRYIMNRVSKEVVNAIRPVPGEHGAFLLENESPKGKISIILSESRRNREGKYLSVLGPKGIYEDIWTGEIIEVPDSGEIRLPAEEGIVILRMLTNNGG